MIRDHWRKAYRFRGLMVLVMWQALPIGTDAHGRTRIGFGAGGGALEYAELNCAGDVIRSDQVPFGHVSGEVMQRFGESGVLHASGGYQWSDSLSARGAFGTFNVGYEGTSFGLKGGLAAIPGGRYYDSPGPRIGRDLILPSVSIRVGNRARGHVKAELMPPAAQGPTDWLNFLYEYNGYDPARPSGSLGIGLFGAAESEGSGGIIGSYFRPVGRQLEVGGRGFFSPGRGNPQMGLTAEVRMTMH